MTMTEMSSMPCCGRPVTSSTRGAPRYVVVDGAPEHRRDVTSPGSPPSVSWPRHRRTRRGRQRPRRERRARTSPRRTRRRPPRRSSTRPHTRGCRCAPTHSPSTTCPKVGDFPLPDPRRPTSCCSTSPGQPSARPGADDRGRGRLRMHRRARHRRRRTDRVRRAFLAPAEREPTADGVVLDDLQIGGGESVGRPGLVHRHREGAGDQVTSVSVDLPDGTSYASGPDCRSIRHRGCDSDRGAALRAGRELDACLRRRTIESSGPARRAGRRRRVCCRADLCRDEDGRSASGGG